MASSQNGWPVATRGQQDERPLIRDIRVPNGVLAGDVAVVFRWLARQYDKRVERLKVGQCWGWFVKVIEGGSSISNHASGTAVDFNAPDNPMGTGTTRRSLTQGQIDTCHDIERESGGVLRWGGDFSRNDPMHWEIIGTRAQVKVFADKIRREEAAAVASQFNTEDREVLQREAKEGVSELTKLNDFPLGGGSGSNVGSSVWGHGFPLVDGDDRDSAWHNIQTMYALMLEIQQEVREVALDVAKIKEKLG